MAQSGIHFAACHRELWLAGSDQDGRRQGFLARGWLALHSSTAQVALNEQTISDLYLHAYIWRSFYWTAMMLLSSLARYAPSGYDWTT